MSVASRIFATLAALLIAAAFLAFRPAGEPGVTMRDFEAYYSAGATWLSHGDPYSLDIWNAESHVPGVVRARHEVLPFVGLPATLPMWSLFARFSYAAAAATWATILALALVVVVAGSWRLARLTPWQLVLIALVSITFVPITSDFVLGQAALPAYAFAILALLATPAFAAIWVACAALQPNVALGLIGLLFSRRTALALLGGVVIAYLASALSSGAAWPFTYAATLAAHANAERFATIQYTPAAILYGFGFGPREAMTAAACVSIAVCAAALTGAFRARDSRKRFAILCCAVPFVAGFFHEHDFVVLFIPAIVALTYSRVPAAATVATVLVGVNWLDFAQQPQAIGQDVILATALFALCVALRPERSQWFAAVICTVAIGGGAWLGHLHPLPIWPNDMTGAPLGDTAAEVWKNEQLQTGLLRPDAAAAVLRSLALLGSALLFYVNLNVDIHHVVERREVVRMEVF